MGFQLSAKCTSAVDEPNSVQMVDCSTQLARPTDGKSSSSKLWSGHFEQYSVINRKSVELSCAVIYTGT